MNYNSVYNFSDDKVVLQKRTRSNKSPREILKTMDLITTVFDLSKIDEDMFVDIIEEYILGLSVLEKYVITTENKVLAQMIQEWINIYTKL